MPPFRRFSRYYDMPIVTTRHDVASLFTRHVLRFDYGVSRCFSIIFRHDFIFFRALHDAADILMLLTPLMPCFFA